jgi:hypothetical protein
VLKIKTEHEFHCMDDTCTTVWNINILVFDSFSVHHMGLVVVVVLVVVAILVGEGGGQVPQEVRHMAMVKEGVSIMHPKVRYFTVIFT